MTEADFRRSFQDRFHREGRGLLWRLPDAPPVVLGDGRMCSAGTRPCDLVGVLRDGRGCAFEVKLQKGGRTFSVAAHFRGRQHQLVELRKFAQMGGYAAIVLGWIPVGGRRVQTFEWPVAEVFAAKDGKIALVLAATT